MLKKGQRMDKKSFELIFERGKNSNFPLFSTKTLLDRSGPRFSFVVSSKVSNKSTTRNLLKRRARHIIRKNIEKIKEKPLVVFFFKKGAEKAKFADLEYQMAAALKKNNLI